MLGVDRGPIQLYLLIPSAVVGAASAASGSMFPISAGEAGRVSILSIDARVKVDSREGVPNGPTSMQLVRNGVGCLVDKSEDSNEICFGGDV